MKFRKKPVVIEAFQTTERVEIHTLEGVMVANVGDWIITGVKGELFINNESVFVNFLPRVRVLAALIKDALGMEGGGDE